MKKMLIVPARLFAISLILVGCSKVEYSGQIFTGDGSEIARAAGIELYILKSDFRLSHQALANNIDAVNSLYGNNLDKFARVKGQYVELRRLHSSLTELEKLIKPVNSMALPRASELLDKVGVSIEKAGDVLKRDYNSCSRESTQFYIMGTNQLIIFQRLVRMQMVDTQWFQNTKNG